MPNKKGGKKWLSPFLGDGDENLPTLPFDTTEEEEEGVEFVAWREEEGQEVSGCIRMMGRGEKRRP